jgi:hypothetical protein
MNNYIVERVPSKYISGAHSDEEIWYCHQRGYDYIPVFGSIGEKSKAVAVCKRMNLDGRVRYS